MIFRSQSNPSFNAKLLLCILKRGELNNKGRASIWSMIGKQRVDVVWSEDQSWKRTFAKFKQSRVGWLPMLVSWSHPSPTIFASHRQPNSTTAYHGSTPILVLHLALIVIVKLQTKRRLVSSSNEDDIYRLTKCCHCHRLDELSCILIMVMAL